MKRLVLVLITRSRWLVLLVPILLTFALFLSAGESDTTYLAGVAVVVVLVAGLVLALNLAGVDPDAEEKAARLHPDPLAQALLTRWLRRSKHFRYVGGVVGFIVGVGTNGQSFAALFILTLGGVALGGILAELHSLSRRRSHTTSASLIARQTHDYSDRWDSLALRAVAIAAVALAVASVFINSDSSRAGLFASIAALLVAASTIALQRAVILRPRPALPDELRRADDLMRRLAATLGFTKAAVRIGISLLAVGVSVLDPSDEQTLLSSLLWILAIGWNLPRRNSPESIAAGAFA